MGRDRLHLAVVVLAGLLLRPLTRERGMQRGEMSPAAPLAPLVVTCLVALVAWAVNPYAALLLVLPANIWPLTASREARIAPPVLVLLVLAQPRARPARDRLGRGALAWR